MQGGQQADPKGRGGTIETQAQISVGVRCLMGPYSGNQKMGNTVVFGLVRVPSIRGREHFPDTNGVSPQLSSDVAIHAQMPQIGVQFPSLLLRDLE